MREAGEVGPEVVDEESILFDFVSELGEVRGNVVRLVAINIEKKRRVSELWVEVGQLNHFLVPFVRVCLSSIVRSHPLYETLHMAALLFVIREPEGLLKTDVNLAARVNSLWVRNKGLAFILTYLFEATVTDGSNCRCYSLRETGLKGLEVLF